FYSDAWSEGSFKESFDRWSPCHKDCGEIPSSNKRKGGQVRFSSEQTSALERRFLGQMYLSPEERRMLAEELKLTDRQVKTWFQNRRAKLKRSSQTSMGEDRRASQPDEPALLVRPLSLTESEGEDDVFHTNITNG
ncbi:hypothetical protein J437_LFUL004293, partial [Ladona fulva]